MYRFANQSKTAVNRIHRNGVVRVTLNYQSRNDSSRGDVPPKNKGVGGSFLVTIGAVTLVTGATLAYAKHDAEFRKFLTGYIPSADCAIKILFQEEKSYSDTIVDGFIATKNSVTKIFKTKKERVAEKLKTDGNNDIVAEYKAPRPAFEPLLIVEKPKDKFTEIRNIKGDDVTLVETAYADTGSNDNKVIDGTDKRTIIELENAIKEASEVAIPEYAKAVTALKNYREQLHLIIDRSIETHNPELWSVLKHKNEEKTKCINKAEEAATKAIDNLEKMRGALEADIKAPQNAIDRARRNLDRVTLDIARAKNEYEEELKKSSITDKYWRKVEQARTYFLEELESLFPGTNICDRKFNVAGNELDLFLLHAVSHLLYYQKELAKLEVIGDNRLKNALTLARSHNATPKELIDIEVEHRLEEEKRCLELEFQKKTLNLRAEAEKALRNQMKLQSEAHADHLKDAVDLKEKEMERLFYRQLEESLAADREQYKTQLAAMLGRVKGMDNALKARAHADKSAQQAQALWGACQALMSAIKANTPTVPWDEQIRPLTTEIKAIEQFTDGANDMVQSIVNGIPEEAKIRGVYSEDALRERFLKVERVARRVALVPEGGARLPIYLLSYLQSALLVSTYNPIPSQELQDKKTDFTKMDTYDILARARYWLDRGDFTQTLRYMNLLTGASRVVANEWLYETRLMLETQQAAHALMAHAQAQGLMYLQ